MSLSLSMRGLELAPAQVVGSVRIVPVIRRNAPGDLRLSKRRYDEDRAAVALSGDPTRPTAGQPWFASYVPHGLVVEWTERGAPAASFGGHLWRRDGQVTRSGVRVMSRLVRREERNRLRMLPLDLAFEGFLALQFGGPDVAWQEYSKRALSRGLSPRSELVIPGDQIRGLDDALRVFEVHDDQVGAALFVADALASVFVASHPRDYLALHESLIQDFYGDLIWHYSYLYDTAGNLSASFPTDAIQAIGDLTRALDRMRADWNASQQFLLGALFDRCFEDETCYTLRPFSLRRFMSELDPRGENHLGECIVRDDGTLEYLKTYRLSAAQTRRAYLLKQLGQHQWNLRECARALRTTERELILRLENAGFGYLLREDVLAGARKGGRRETEPDPFNDFPPRS